MALQRVELIGVRQRHLDRVDLVLDRIEPVEQLFGRARAHVGLDLAQLRVPAKHARADAQLDDRRHDARQRQQHGDDRQHRQPHAIDQVGQPERQKALQPRHAAPVEALGFGGERAFAVACVREVALPLEPARVAVDLARGLHEQLCQRRMQVFAHHQRGRRRDHAHVGRGHVARQVDHAARQRHRGQKAEAARVGVGLRKVEERDARRLQQHLHHRRLGRRGQHERIETAFEQLDHGRRDRLLRQRDRARLDAVGVEQLCGQVRHAAAGHADIDAPTGELRQAVQRWFFQQALRAVGAVEQPYRLVEHAAQRLQCGVRALHFARAALHEADLHARRSIAQQRQVFRRALRVAQLNIDAVLLQSIGVALAELGIRALRDAGGQHDAARRIRVEQPVGQRDQPASQQHERRAGGQRGADAGEDVMGGHARCDL